MSETLRCRTVIPIYGPKLNVTLFVADDILPLIQKYCPKDEQDEAGDKVTVAMRILQWPNAYLLFSQPSLSHNAIAHEIDHLTHKIMREIGMAESQDSEEAYTHLNGWLAEWIYKKLKKATITVNC